MGLETGTKLSDLVTTNPTSVVFTALSKAIIFTGM